MYPTYIRQTLCNVLIIFNTGFKTRLSSAGLVYKHFGKEILSKMLEIDLKDEKNLQTVYLQVYKHFMEAIDANDNGNYMPFN